MLLWNFKNATSAPVWTEQNVDIPAQDEPFNIIIRGRVTSGSRGDAAIDDLSVRSGPCA